MPVQAYVPLKIVEGEVIRGGYKCGACGLEGLAYGEAHYRASGGVCEPAEDGSAPAIAANGAELVDANPVVAEVPAEEEAPEETPDPYYETV